MDWTSDGTIWRARGSASLMTPNKDTESPSQYYLSELGLNLEWRNSLLQFGPSVPLPLVNSPGC